MAELADALDSGSSALRGVRVQIPPSAPSLSNLPYHKERFYRRFFMAGLLAYRVNDGLIGSLNVGPAVLEPSTIPLSISGIVDIGVWQYLNNVEP